MLKHRLMRRMSAFTLVELMIVVVIVAILALVAIPMYTTNVTRARMSEVVAAAGAVRSAARTYMATHGGTVSTSLTDLGFGANDLTGRYVTQSEFVVASAGAGAFTVTWDGSKAANATSDMKTYTYVVDQVGKETGTYKTGE